MNPGTPNGARAENRASYDPKRCLSKLGRKDQGFFILANKSVCFEMSGRSM